MSAPMTPREEARGRGGDSVEALRKVWMEGYERGKRDALPNAEKALFLAQLVRRAWQDNDAACMRLFGSNTTAMLAFDVERAALAPYEGKPAAASEPCKRCDEADTRVGESLAIAVKALEATRDDVAMHARDHNNWEALLCQVINPALAQAKAFQPSEGKPVETTDDTTEGAELPWKTWICENCGQRWPDDAWPEAAFQTGRSKKYRGWKLKGRLRVRPYAIASWCSQACFEHYRLPPAAPQAETEGR